ncbi:MAG: M20 family metallopeptidase [Clostridia bacterium]|nr:M20 family metallopeptidase [Clostridia bacterium]
MLKVENVLEDLVKYNTIKDKENKEILDYIEKILNLIGFKTEKRDRFLIMSNKDETSLGFLGHTDTVEFVDGWKYEKFRLTKVNDKIYGLGVCDMKSGIAAIIAAISQIDFNKFNKGIKLYFSYDEEIGFSGIKEIVKCENNFPETMIIGEPTNNEIIVGSKGLIEYKISFKGIKCHSSTPEKGKNAIMSAVSFINELNEFYQNEIKTILDKNFEIPYTTMNLGTINGGSAINSVPEKCEILIDFRTINKFVEEIIINEIEKLRKKYLATVQELNKLSPFFNESKLSKKTCNFITEASFIKSNCMILGAGPITAHETNEYVNVNSLYKLVEQYKKLIEKFCKL